MNTKTSTRFLVVGLLAFAVPIAFGAPIYFGGTDHFYELVGQSGLNWGAADAAAQAKSHLGTNGYLATITSAAENTFITDNLLSAEPVLPGYWLGGLQPQGSAEPGGGWEWDTAETWSYTNWDPAEPNNDNQGEDRLEIWGAAALAGKWNDVFGGSTHLRGYIVEYPIPEPVTLGLLLLGGLAMLRSRIIRR